MSGWRWRGSSSGRGWKDSRERLPVSVMMRSANSIMVTSAALPALIGPVRSAGAAMNLSMASIMSLTWQNERVCRPSP